MLVADHPDTQASIYNLENALYSQDKFAEAESLYQRALTETENAKSRPPCTLASANNLANALYTQDKFAEAEALHQRARYHNKIKIQNKHQKLSPIKLV